MEKGYQKYDRIAYLFIAPNYIIYVVFVLFPIISVLYLSSTDYSILKAPQFVGISNYISLFRDAVFLRAMRNTFVYWIFTVSISMVTGIILAVVLNSRTNGMSFFRSVYYLPNVISMVAVALTWVWIYDPSKGILNTVLVLFGGRRADWLLDPRLAMGCIIVPSVWALLGYNMVVYLAGLHNIPEELYEAAKIDGASNLRKFTAITVPMLRPITFFLFVTSSIKSFQVFDQIYVMTRGGPVKSTTTIAYELYENGFQFYKMGYASSMAVVLLLIVAVITIVNFAYGKQGYGEQM